MDLKTIFIALLLALTMHSFSQRTFSEGTIQFDISVQTGKPDPQLADMFDGAQASIQLRGGLSRSELVSALGSTVTIFDHRAGTGVVLREFGPQKLLIRMDKDDWTDKNRRYQGIRFIFSKDTKTIAGYPCVRAEAVMPDSSRFMVWFTRQLVAENASFDPQFSLLPGTALEYESTVGGIRVKYAAVNVSFDPVPINRFEVPKSGYREMNYAESQPRKSGN
ncbi:MAG: hypothetical protein FJX89_02285 [Bacteroidetes bacterium]|nr:hypothetical protein [Bacteroidota bacterium]